MSGERRRRTWLHAAALAQHYHQDWVAIETRIEAPAEHHVDGLSSKGKAALAKEMRELAKIPGGSNIWIRLGVDAWSGQIDFAKFAEEVASLCEK